MDSPRRGNRAEEKLLFVKSDFWKWIPPKGQLGGRKALKIYKLIYDQLKYFKNTSNRINDQLKYFKIHQTGSMINSNTLKYIKPDLKSTQIL